MMVANIALTAETMTISEQRYSVLRTSNNEVHTTLLDSPVMNQSNGYRNLHDKSNDVTSIHLKRKYKHFISNHDQDSNVLKQEKKTEMSMWNKIKSDADPKQHHHYKTEIKESWLDGLMHSTIMIISMEFMDKTFFISAIMAMTHNKWVILASSLAALFLMNAISCAMGVVIPILMSRTVTISIAAVLFMFFGIKMILSGFQMSNEDHGEFSEAEEEIKTNFRTDPEMLSEADPLVASSSSSSKLCSLQINVIVQVFLMIFFAEWGDRSQISTILLAGTHPVLSVYLGGCLGYFITNLLAVVGGSYLASKISPKIITIFGGIMFILFALQIVIMK